MKIPKKYWNDSFEKWYNFIVDVINKIKPSLSAGSCGYCKFYPNDWSGVVASCDCPLKPNICGHKKKSYYWKVSLEIRGPYKIRWKLLLRWSRKIFTAIVDDGRRLGYVGKQEEVKIKEVLGD